MGRSWASLACAALAATGAAAQERPRPSLPPPTVGVPTASQLPAIEDVARSMRYCAAGPEADRMGCYDQVAVALGGRPAIGRSVRQYAWTVDAPQTFDGRLQRATLSLGASEVSAADDLFSRPDANLVIRCRSGEVHTWVSFPSAVARAPVPVVIRFDAHTGTSATWENSESGAAIGVWRDREDAVGFVRKLRDVRRLALSFTLPGGRAVSTTFDVDKYSGIPDAAREACGLK